MASSGSDSENEYFESAEESFDENDEVENEEIKLNKKQQKSENETAKPVVSDCNAVDSVGAIEGDTSSNPLSYRKRPERVKRLPNRAQIKPIPKSPTNELIFKTDKIVSDVFFQDITSNLSKNLNKSLNTLQQTSSNVKDLILNSLPVSSVGESEGFSYDDKSVSVQESEAINNETETSNQNNNEPKELYVNNTEKEKSNEKNLSVTDRANEGKNDKKPEDIRNNNLEREDFLSKDDAVDDNIEKNLLSFVKENLENCTNTLDSDAMQEPAKNNYTEAVKIVSEEAKEDLKDLKDLCSNHETFETLGDHEHINSNDNNKSESINFTEGTNQELKACTENKEICTDTTVVVRKEEEFFNPDELVGLVKSDISDNDKNDINSMMEEKQIIDTECNFEELKMALKNIVNEENISMKENINLEDNTEVNENSGDGWEDFDFSDDEVEKPNVNHSDRSKNNEYTKTNEKLTKNEPEISDVKSVNDKREVETKKSRNLISPPKDANSVIAEREDIKDCYKEAAEKPTKYVENNSEENDSWDWDNWDEIPESKEVSITFNKNSEIKKVKDNSLDVSKWSGWDTFAQKPQEKQDNWSLGSWGVDMLLNKATAVTQGISSVLEAGLGAPDPETLARMEKIQRDNLTEAEKEVLDTENEHPPEIPKKNSLTNVNIFPVTGITNLVAGVTSKIVEHSKIQEIGSKVITGGLETLETFGKKTMEVLQEGDPGLKNKRALLLGNNKPVLSQVLKEAREKADRESKKAEEKELARKCHFETLFDDFQGMVHLEALEMLSRQCELKLDQIRSGMNSEEQEDLNGILEEVEQLCSLDECDIYMKSSVLDFKTLLHMVVEPLKNEISVHNIIQIHEDVNKWLQMSSEAEPSFTIINQKLVSTLAELTAAIVHQFHKSGELLSVKECRKTVEEVDVLSRLTNALCTEINKLGEKFIKLSSNSSSEDISGKNIDSINEKVNIVTKNSVVYIKQAFDLLIPVIQLGAAV